MAIVLLVLYFVHILLMKFNYYYEVAIKKSVARSMEIKELTRIAHKDIAHFHKNLNSRAVSIEVLKSVDYRVEDQYIIFDTFHRKKIKDPCVVIKDDNRIPLAMLDDRGYVARTMWKKAAIKVIIRLQAYTHFEKLKRNEKAKVSLARVLTFMNNQRTEADDSVRNSDSSGYFEGESNKGKKAGDSLMVKRTGKASNGGDGDSVGGGKSPRAEQMSEFSEGRKSEGGRSSKKEEEQDNTSSKSGTVA